MRPAPQQVLSLYRAVLRASQLLPVQNRRDWVQLKAREEFGAARDETDDAQITFLYALGETQLESITVQAKTLDVMFEQEPRLPYVWQRWQDNLVSSPPPSSH